MGAVIQLFQRHAGERREAARAPVVTGEGLRLPDDFDFDDLRAFIEAAAPARGGPDAGRAAG